MHADVAADPDTAFTIHQARAHTEIDRECVRVAWRSVRDKVGKRRFALPAQQRQPPRKDQTAFARSTIWSEAARRIGYAGSAACTR